MYVYIDIDIHIYLSLYIYPRIHTSIYIRISPMRVHSSASGVHAALVEPALAQAAYSICHI